MTDHDPCAGSSWAVCVPLPTGRDGLAPQEGPGSGRLGGVLMTTVMLSEMEGDVVAHY